MEQTIKEKICQLLKSNEEEMVNLAVTMFKGLTNDYYDYFDIRTMYGGGIVIQEPLQHKAFAMMFEGLDKTNIMKKYRHKAKSYPKNANISACKMLTLTSKQKRTKTQKDAKKRIKLATN